MKTYFKFIPEVNLQGRCLVRLELNILTFSSTPIDKHVPGYVLLYLLWTASDILEYCCNNENLLSHRLSNLFFSYMFILDKHTDLDYIRASK